jgi:hypothetical protein
LFLSPMMTREIMKESVIPGEDEHRYKESGEQAAPSGEASGLSRRVSLLKPEGEVEANNIGVELI